MKKILMSVLAIGVVGVAVAYGTGAFFSDTETSTGNTFTAGAIDLLVSSHFTDYTNVLGGFTATDLNGRTLFTFADMKPGDMGGGRFDIKASTNPYWACMKTEVTAKPENLVIEPESADLTAGTNDGELQNYMSFYFWNDLNGDGVYTPGNTALDRNLFGPLTLAQVQAAGYLPLADATGVPGPSFFSGSPLNPNQEYNLGYQFCFGTWGANPLASGLSCSGAGDHNLAQTDGVVGDIEFYAIQSRNNMQFTCASMNPEFVLDVERSGQNVAYNQQNKTNGWPYVDWTIDGDQITFNFINPTGITNSFYFDYRVDTQLGNPVGGVTGATITSGRLAGQVWGNFYTFAVVPAHSTVTRVINGTDEIAVRLMLGPERDYDFDWIVFRTN